MYAVYKKSNTGKSPTKLKTFTNYKDAYYFICEKFSRREDGLHYSYSLKYMMSGYDKTKLFEYGCIKFKRFGSEYEIQSLN
jgi:hypothetical protein